MSDRQKVSADFINGAMNEMRKELCRRINEKGEGGFVSGHEIVGVVAQEFDELKEAVQHKAVGSLGVVKKEHDVKSELLDIAVACVFGAACINAGTLDW